MQIYESEFFYLFIFMNSWAFLLKLKCNILDFEPSVDNGSWVNILTFKKYFAPTNIFVILQNKLGLSCDKLRAQLSSDLS